MPKFSDWKQALSSSTVRSTALFATGFSLAIAIVGRPSWAAALWSEEAAGWASAVGAFVAVVVALASGSASMRWLKAEKVEQENKADVRKLAIASVIDYELYNVGSAVQEVIVDLGDRDAVITSPRKAHQWVRHTLNRESTPMMERFASDLDLFGSKEASILLSALSGWQTLGRVLPDIREATLEDFPDKAVAKELFKYRSALQVLLRQLGDARRVTHAYHVRVRPDVPAEFFDPTEDF